ncbi:MAG: hypothetical protein RR800_03185, partial [Comamonas sp.]
TVLRDASSTSQFSQDRYDAIRGVQQDNQPDPNVLMRNVSAAPVLPQRLPPAPQPRVVPSAQPVSMTLPTPLLNVPGGKPELVDFSDPQHPKVNGNPAPAPSTLSSLPEAMTSIIHGAQQ